MEDEELRKLLGYIIHWLHTIVVAQTNIAHGIESLSKKEDIDFMELNKNNERLHNGLREELEKLIGEDHEIMQIVKRIRQ